MVDYQNHKCIERAKLADKIDALKPELQIKDRIDAWNGISYYFIILEVYDCLNNKKIGVFRTTSKPYTYVQTKCRRWIKDGFQHGNFDIVSNGFEEALLSWNAKGTKRKEILEDNLKYFYVKKMVKDKNKLWDIAREILKNAINNKYDDIERNSYIKPDNRWKAEELVYKYVKKYIKQIM